MAGDFVLCIDQGTTGSRAILIDRDGNIKGSAYSEFRQIFPQPGWVEHDPEEIWQHPAGDCRGARHGGRPARPTSPPSASPTSARPRSSGTARPASPFTTPSSGSAGARPAFCDQLKAAGKEPMFRARTGLVLDAYFSGTKIEWLLDNVNGARERAADGRAGLRHH